jgi:hypothetical protein
MPLILVVGACTGGATPRPSEPTTFIQPALRTYDSGPSFLHLTFEYPASWTARHYDDQSTMSTAIVFLSDQRMTSPCQDGGCGLPLRHLNRGAVLVWTEWGFPDWSFDKDAKGQPLTVGGRRARLLIEPGCHQVGGEVSMKAVVERPQAPDNWYELDACIRGPGVDQVEAQVRALLASTRFGKEG